MAFVNLPPNFQDMFYALSDRIAKLETGPNQAMYTAEAAQGSSAQATAEAAQALSQAQAANALGVQALAEANIAIAQGTQAIQTANEALVEADAAYALGAQSLQKSASTITNASNQITAINGNGITVYSGASASSGARVVLNSAGLAGFNSGGTATFSIDASTGGVSTNGAIFTSSTITGGSLNINGNAIINSSGFLTAVGATITGNITATSGTFTGTVNATSGTFTGTITSSNATITGGSLNVGGNFIVTSAGALTATGANITGAITATSGTFTGTVNASSGTIGGFALSSTSIASGTSLVISSTGTITGGNSQTLFYGFVNIGGGFPTGERLIVAGTSALNGNTGVLGNLTVTNSCTFGAITQQFEFLSSSGNVRVAQTYNTSVSGRTMLVSTSGLYGTSASTERKKHNIQPYAIDANALLQLEPVSFNYIESIDEEQNPEYGFIAEDADRLGLYELVGYDKEGLPEYFAYEKLPVFLLQVVKDQDARLKILEGN
jgi:hypothetical protein